MSHHSFFSFLRTLYDNSLKTKQTVGEIANTLNLKEATPDQRHPTQGRSKIVLIMLQPFAVMSSLSESSCVYGLLELPVLLNCLHSRAG